MNDDAPPLYPGTPSSPPSPPEPVESPEDSDTKFAALLTELTPRAYVTPLLVVANVAVFVAMIASGVHFITPSVQDVLDWGANYAPVTTDGQWWRLWTSTYLHFGFVHLAFNMAVLWDAGRTVERMVGNGSYFAMYTVSGVAGSLASAAVHGNSVSAGASGAVFGVFGCLGGILVMKKSSVSKGAMSRMGRDVAVFLGYNLLFGMGTEGIDMAAHIGGLAGGFVCGLVLASPLDLAAVAQRPKRALTTVVIGVVAVGVGIVAIPKSKLAALDEFARVEAVVIPVYNDLIERAQSGDISDEEAVEVLQRDIIAPWAKAHAALREIDPAEIDGKQAKRFALVLDYARLREEGWRLFADAIRSDDSTTAEQAVARQQAAEEILQRLTALSN